MPPRVRASYQLQAVGRMKAGVSLEAAQADLAAVADGLAREYPEFNQGRSVTVEPLHDTMVGSDLKTTSMLFLGVVGFVLLICCANVANLLLARATARSRELAVRSALGAGRRRIIRQLLTESVVLSLIGGALGIAIGAAILQVAPVLIPQGLLPAAVTLSFDLRIVAFCAAAALLVGVVFGIAPAFQATAMAAHRGDGRRQPHHDRRRRTPAQPAGDGRGGDRRPAVVRCGAAAADVDRRAVVRPWLPRRQHSVDAGRSAGNRQRYPPPTKQQQLYDQIEAEVRALPGVADVAWSSGAAAR